MHTTSFSLLQQLRESHAHTAWLRFVDLYTPLLYHWAQRLRLQDSDAADLVQDVFTILVRKLPTFEYDRDKSFRAWLKTVFTNQHRQRCRARQLITGVESWDDAPDPAVADPAEVHEYRRYVTQRLLHLIEPEFSPTLWQAFQRYVLLGHDPTLVARELGIGPGTVYSIKSKVLQRLRQELQNVTE